MFRALPVGIGYLLVLVLVLIPFSSAFALTGTEQAKRSDEGLIVLSYVKVLLNCELKIGDYEKRTWNDYQRNFYTKQCSTIPYSIDARAIKTTWPEMFDAMEKHRETDDDVAILRYMDALSACKLKVGDYEKQTWSWQQFGIYRSGCEPNEGISLETIKWHWPHLYQVWRDHQDYPEVVRSWKLFTWYRKVPHFLEVLSVIGLIWWYATKKQTKQPFPSAGSLKLLRNVFILAVLVIAVLSYPQISEYAVSGYWFYIQSGFWG